MNYTVRHTISMKSDLEDMIERLCVEKGMTFSGVISVALREYFKGQYRPNYEKSMIKHNKETRRRPA